jgi:hypothetical protein
MSPHGVRYNNNGVKISATYKGRKNIDGHLRHIYSICCNIAGKQVFDHEELSEPTFFMFSRSRIIGTILDFAEGTLPEEDKYIYPIFNARCDLGICSE